MGRLGRYSKILVAFDGSESSINALRQAVKLAKEEQSEVKVLAVVPSYEGELELVGVRDIKKTIAGPSEELLSEAKKAAQADATEVTASVEQGEPYEKIVDVADKEGCDLIVMGRRGIKRLERMLMGSVTARVVGHSDRDVLVIPRDASIGWTSIVAAVDGSGYSEVAMKRAADFAKSHGASLSVVYVVDVTDEFYAQAPRAVERMVEDGKVVLQKMGNIASAAGLKADTYVREGEPHRWIMEIAEEKKADLVFMGSHGRKGLKRLLMGSVTEKVIGLAHVPVLVAKGEEA